MFTFVDLIRFIVFGNTHHKIIDILVRNPNRPRRNFSSRRFILLKCISVSTFTSFWLIDQGLIVPTNFVHHSDIFLFNRVYGSNDIRSLLTSFVSPLETSISISFCFCCSFFQLILIILISNSLISRASSFVIQFEERSFELKTMSLPHSHSFLHFRNIFETLVIWRLLICFIKRSFSCSRSTTFYIHRSLLYLFLTTSSLLLFLLLTFWFPLGFYLIVVGKNHNLRLHFLKIIYILFISIALIGKLNFLFLQLETS